MTDLKNLFRQAEAAHGAMMETWRFLVDRDCGPDNKEGVDRVGDDIAHFLRPLGFAVRFHDYEKAGNMLIAEYGDMTKPFVILTGHMDTVFAKGTAAARPFTVKDGKVYGPGALDMKGGVTILLYAVKLLIAAGYDRHPLKIILAGDEETGHARSHGAADYMAESQGAIAGFNLETGFMDGRIITARKGVYQCRFDVDGIGAHAGNNPEDGRSAVAELARKVADIEALTDWDKGTNVNVGVFQGGTVSNAVPEHAFCQVDVRFKTNDELARVKKGFDAIAAKVYREGTHTTVTPIVGVSAMEELPGTEALFEKASAAAEKAGLGRLTRGATGGGSDSAYLAAAGVPTLCALGVQGEFNHTVREYAVEASLTERLKLLLAILMAV